MVSVVSVLKWCSKSSYPRSMDLAGNAEILSHGLRMNNMCDLCSLHPWSVLTV